MQSRFLASLSVMDREAVRPLLTARDFATGETLAEPGRAMDSVYFPETGIVSVVSPTRVEIEIALIGREGVLAAPTRIGLDAIPFRARVQLGGRILTATARSIDAALDASPTLRTRFAMFAHVFMLQAASTAYANTRFTVEQRLARWLLMVHDRLEHDDIALTHDFLATMLSVRRPGVTVATHVLEGLHAIRATRGHVAILDRAKLASLAGDSYGFAEAEYERLMPIDDESRGPISDRLGLA